MHQKRIDKLLNILKRKTNKNVKIHDSEVMSFIEFYNIKSGRIWVRSTVLYKLYRAWGEHTFDLKTFKFIMAKYLPYKTGKGFKISTSSLDISKKALELIVPSQKAMPVIRTKYIHAFIEEHQLQSGVMWHLDALVFRVYTKWCKKKRITSVLFHKFNSIMKTLVDYKITDKQKLYFGLNKDLRQKDETQRGEKKKFNETIKI